jgi:adenosylcobinamide-GDP ribazoletransferase
MTTDHHNATQTISLNGLLRALGFLSRIPAPARAYEHHARHVTADDVALFPVAALVIALPGAVVIWLGAGSPPAVILALSLTIIMTGALHEDGLADCADGLFGGNDVERRLAIMKDSAIGTYGVLALVALFLLHTMALIQIAMTSPMAAGLIFLGAAACSRAIMVGHWWSLPNARNDGTANHAGQPRDRAAIIAIMLGLVLFIVLAAGSIGLFAALLSATMAILVAAGFGRLARGRIGGHTGDTIGACQQLTHGTMIVTLALVL